MAHDDLPPPGAPLPPATPPPSRAWIVGANATMLVALASSFAACSEYGCSSNHLDSTATSVLAALTFALALAAVFGTIVVVRRRTDALGHSTGSVGSFVLTCVVAVFTGLLGPFFWLAAGASGGIGLGGWGRPLRVGRRAVTPGVRASRDWARGPRPRVEGLARETREVLRDLWLHDARKEHASVPAFGQVAWQLVALGAPSDLVRRAHTSALQEIDHAERCFALASAYAGRDLGVQPMPALHQGGAELPRDRVRALVKVATEALVDGALLEDYNAELAATALADVREPAAREALLAIVRDEREHAALAWDILAFCVAEGGAPVVRALATRMARLGDEPTSLYDPELVARLEALPPEAREELHAHGRVRSSCVLDVYRARKAAATARLASILEPCARAA